MSEQSGEREGAEPQGARRPPALPPVAEAYVETGVPVAEPASPAFAELGYAAPDQRRRPGILTTVGVLSIVLGALGIMTGALSVLSMWGFMFMARSMPAVPAGGVVPTARLAWGLISPEEIETAVGAMDPSQALSATQEEVLRAFLTRHGPVVFPQVARPWTSDQIVRQVQGATIGSGGPSTFDVPAGSLTVAGDGASWTPRAVSQFQSLAPREVEAVVQAIARLASSPPTMEQYATVRKMLAGSQSFVTPPRNADAGAQISGALVDAADGSLTVYSQNGSMLYVPKGAVVSPAPAATRAPRVQPATTGPSGPTSQPGGGVVNVAVATRTMNLSSTAAVLGVGSAVVSAILAVYLLVAGIMVFRSPPRTRRMHLIYGVAKIVEVLVGTAAIVWMVMALLGPVGAGGMFMMPLWIGFTTILPLLYPIGVLIVMNTQGVRAYYRALGA